MASEKNWQYQADDPGFVLTNDGTVKDNSTTTAWWVQAFLLNLVAMKEQDGTAISIGSAVGKWTCDGSSDGVTGALDGVNRWGGGTYDAAKFVKAADGVAHSWFAMHSAQQYWCFDYTTAAGNDRFFRMWCSKNAFTGGSVTDRPTAVNEFEVLNQTTPIPFGPSATGGGSGQTGPHHAHGRLATDGAFFIMTSHDGFGFFNFFLHGDNLADLDPYGNDTYPYVAYGVYSAAASSPSASNLYSDNHKQRRANGGAGGGGFAVYPAYNGGTYAMATIDATNGKYRAFPMFVQTTSPDSWRGRYADWKWATTTLVDGDLDSLSVISRMVVGETWVPARAAPSL